jgi:uncharacterized membrane protein
VILPVRLTGTFDMKHEPQGVAPLAPPGSPLAPLVWPAAARFFWMNTAAPTPTAQVWLTAGNYPLLVVDKCGQGRVATVLGTCHGEPTRDTIPAWRTRAWTQMLTQTLQWLQESK